MPAISGVRHTAFEKLASLMVTRSNVVSISAGNHRAKVVAKRDALVTAHLHLVPPIARRIRRTLPPSFDLDDLIAEGNKALVGLATRFNEKRGVPFESYARAGITGAIRDSFRRRKLTENTHESLSKVVEFPNPRGLAFIERLGTLQRFESLRSHIIACLGPVEARVISLYYSPSAPNMATVAEILGISRNMAYKAHTSAIRTLKARLAPAC